MRVRRLRKTAAHLEITAFINLIVVLVPFLLSTAVFSRLAVIDLTLPAQNSGIEKVLPNNLQLEIVVRANGLEVGDRLGGLIKRIDNSSGGHDLAALSALMLEIKTRFPDKSEVTVLAEPNTPYDVLVQVLGMDLLSVETQSHEDLIASVPDVFLQQWTRAGLRPGSIRVASELTHALLEQSAALLKIPIERESELPALDHVLSSILSVIQNEP